MQMKSDRNHMHTATIKRDKCEGTYAFESACRRFQFSFFFFSFFFVLSHLFHCFRGTVPRTIILFLVAIWFPSRCVWNWNDASGTHMHNFTLANAQAQRQRWKLQISPMSPRSVCWITKEANLIKKCNIIVCKLKRSEANTHLARIMYVIRANQIE